MIGERAPGDELPLLLFHDVCWPHGRRDDYFDRRADPADYRQPLVGEGAGIFPGDRGTPPGGLPYPRSAAREGGARNGVLTAVEDFVASRDGLRLAVVPAFFGFGAVWHSERTVGAPCRAGPRSAGPQSAARPAGGQPGPAHRRRARAARADLGLQERLTRQEHVLRPAAHSSAFAVAERLSTAAASGPGSPPDQSVVSKRADPPRPVD